MSDILNNEKLEAEFHAAMLSVYRSALSECGYRATRFLQMVNEQGGLLAAKSLLLVGGYSDGLTALWEHSRLGLSMEALVLQKPWSVLFTEEQLAIARKRLRDLGYLQ